MICEKYFSKLFESIVPRRKNTEPNPKPDRLPTEIQLHTAPRTHKVNFTWTIDELDFHIMKKKFLKSCKFSAITSDESKWRLVCVPFDVRYTSVDFMPIYLGLHFIPAQEDIKALAKGDVCLLNGQQKKVFRTTIPVRQFDNIVSLLVPIRATKKRILPGNKLTIQFNLTYSYTQIDDSVSTRDNNKTPPRQLQIPRSERLEKFASMYRSDTFKDVLISVKGKNYSAHKVILAAYSPVFALIFKLKGEKGSITQVKIHDVNEKVFGEMLRYIYTGRCKNLETLARDLLIAADRYRLDRLKMICADALLQKLSVENATDLLILANDFDIKELKSEVIRFIAEKYGQISNEEAWRQAIRDNPHLIIQINQELWRRFTQ
ncbi:speckle-type POZ protein-like [Planococcus citri]|uniref:speckle-type POZ protein-like n=1 Tax=Planococcus citri TaxID=170843 RepID=UPI0031F78A0A